MLVHKECQTLLLIQVVEFDAYNKRKKKKIVNTEPTINSEWTFSYTECTPPEQSDSSGGENAPYLVGQWKGNTNNE